MQLESFVNDDKVMTSPGPGTVLDFSFKLVAKFAGKQKRGEVEMAQVR